MKKRASKLRKRRDDGVRRVPLSVTVRPENAEWVRKVAALGGHTPSEVVDELLTETQTGSVIRIGEILVSCTPTGKLWLSRPGGEAMELGTESEAALAAVLEAFWKAHF